MLQHFLKSEELKTYSYHQKKEWAVIGLGFISLRVTKLARTVSTVLEIKKNGRERNLRQRMPEKNDMWKHDKEEIFVVFVFLFLFSLSLLKFISF